VAAFDVVEVVDVIGDRGGQFQSGGAFASVEEHDLKTSP
jgi:hypothetical protein